MNITEQRLLRGRNLYSSHPCLLTVIDLGPMRELCTSAIDGFCDSLLELLPSLYDHRCSAGKYAGFVQSLRAGTNLAHVIEHVTIALQCLAGTPTSTGRTHGVAGQPGCYRVVCSYEIEQVAEDAFDAAMALVSALAQGSAGVREQLAQALIELRQTAEDQAIGTSSTLR